MCVCVCVCVCARVVRFTVQVNMWSPHVCVCVCVRVRSMTVIEARRSSLHEPYVNLDFY